MVRVKICGITTVSDALWALDFGADAVGLVFAKSPRQVSVRLAEKISRAVGPWMAVCGVFVDEPPVLVRRIAGDVGLSAIQLHGSEPPQEIGDYKGLKVIKTFHVDEKFRLERLKSYRKADAFLFDTKVGDRLGGTGKTFDWKVLKKISTEKPVIISGGLNPQNVAAAVRFFRPYGVDVSSGVEKKPGKKDLNRIRDFIRNAKKIEF